MSLFDKTSFEMTNDYYSMKNYEAYNIEDRNIVK